MVGGDFSKLVVRRFLRFRVGRLVKTKKVAVDDFWKFRLKIFSKLIG